MERVAVCPVAVVVVRGAVFDKAAACAEACRPLIFRRAAWSCARMIDRDSWALHFSSRKGRSRSMAPPSLPPTRARPRGRPLERGVSNISGGGIPLAPAYWPSTKQESKEECLTKAEIDSFAAAFRRAVAYRPIYRLSAHRRGRLLSDAPPYFSCTPPSRQGDERLRADALSALRAPINGACDSPLL